MDRAALLAAEPAPGRAAQAAFLVPREYLIDPWSAPFAYLLQALENGARLLRGAEVTGARRDGDWWIETSRGRVQAGLVVNAAGTYGDRVEALLLGRQDFQICPRKG